MKGYKGDNIAYGAIVVAMILAFLVLPEHLGLMRGGTALLIGVILFFAYVFGLRKPDSLLELEELLRQSAANAKQILKVAQNQGENKLGKQIGEIAKQIAHVTVKCFTRDLYSIEAHVRRLARVAKDFVVVLNVLSGGVRVRNHSAEVEEIRSVKIPDIIRTLDEIEVAIDAVAAKAYEAAEDDLETLSQIANLSAKGQEAVQMLRDIIREKPEGAR